MNVLAGDRSVPVVTEVPDSATLIEEGASLQTNGPPVGGEEEERQRDVKDKERWARLKRVSQVFRTKIGSKRGSMIGSSRPTTSGTSTSVT